MGVNQTGKPYFCGFSDQGIMTRAALYSKDLLQAKRFDSETKAWYAVYDELGMDYGQRNFIVAGVHDKAFLNVNIKTRGDNNG